MNALARKAWTALAAEYPQWKSYLSALDNGDIELAVPAPSGSSAGHLVIFTTNGQDLWIRFGPPHACYALDDEKEMIQVVRELLANRVAFVVVTQAEKWIETTLIKTDDRPTLEPGQVGHVVSWTGIHDREVI